MGSVERVPIASTGFENPPRLSQNVHEPFWAFLRGLVGFNRAPAGFVDLFSY